MRNPELYEEVVSIIYKKYDLDDARYAVENAIKDGNFRFAVTNETSAEDLADVIHMTPKYWI